MSEDPRVIEPDEIRARSFPLSLRGFDPDDVRVLLLALADAVESLEAGTGALADFPMPLEQMRNFEFETTWKGADRDEVHQFLGEVADYAEFRSSRRQPRTSLLNGGRPRLTAVSSEPSPPADPPDTPTPRSEAVDASNGAEELPLPDRQSQPAHLTPVAPTNTAEPTDAHPGPTHTAEPTDAHPGPTHTAEPTDAHPGPTNTAEPTDTHVTPTNTAEPTDAHVTPTNTAEHARPAELVRDGTATNPPPTSASHADIPGGGAQDPAEAAPTSPIPAREPDPRLDMSSVFDSEIGAIIQHARAAAAKITEDAERRAQEYYESATAEATERIDAELGEARSDLAQVRRDAEQLRIDGDAARRSADEYAQSVCADADEHAQRVRAEADEHAQRVRAEADEHAQRVRSEADGYAEHVRAETDDHAQTLRSGAEADAAETRRRADEHATALTAEAERLRTEAEEEVRRRVAETLAEARGRLERLIEAETAVRASLAGIAETAGAVLQQPATDLDAVLRSAVGGSDDDGAVEADSHAA